LTRDVETAIAAAAARAVELADDTRAVRRAAEADVTLAARAAELAAANSSRTERLTAAREAGGVAQVGQAGRQGLSCTCCLRSRCVLYMCEQLPDRIEKAGFRGALLQLLWR
jgi:hypothetical protein